MAAIDKLRNHVEAVITANKGQGPGQAAALQAAITAASAFVDTLGKPTRFVKLGEHFIQPELVVAVNSTGALKDAHAEIHFVGGSVLIANLTPQQVVTALEG